MDSVIVRFVDLSPRGVGLLSPHAVTPGRVVQLRVGLPMADGRSRETRLRLSVTSCGTSQAHGSAAARVWRLGGTVATCNDADRDALVESSVVLAAASHLSGTAQLLADIAALEPDDDGLALELSELTESLVGGR